MDWWQIVLIVLTSIVVGLLVGGLLSYLITRLPKKLFVKKREAPAVVEEQPKFTAPALVAEVEKNRGAATGPWTDRFLPLESAAPALVAEVENNRRIATEPWTGKLLPFQTGVWDTNGDKVHTLPANLRETLTQAYADMRLGNDIVWLSTELGCRSPNLDEKYMKLCTSIASRFDRITPLLKQSGN